MDPLLHVLDLCGTGVFAASGALSAARRRMDVVGFCLLAAVTGIGGGTLRDLLLGVRPVGWLTQPNTVLLCLGLGVAVFFTAHHLESRFRALLWADAAGLAVFSVTGAGQALAAGADPLVAALMGVVTATFGGIIRDVLCAEMPLILHREIYVTAAAAGAGTFVLAASLLPDIRIAEILGLATAFAARAGGILAAFSLPTYPLRREGSRPEAGRD